MARKKRNPSCERLFIVSNRAQSQIVAWVAEICPPGPASSRRALSRVLQIRSSEHLNVQRGQFKCVCFASVLCQAVISPRAVQTPGSRENGQVSVFRLASRYFDRLNPVGTQTGNTVPRLAILMPYKCCLTASNRSAGRSYLSASCCNLHSRLPR